MIIRRTPRGARCFSQQAFPLESTMNLLERYIFRRTLSLSLVTLSATTVMVLITQVLIYVNLLTASGQALVTFFTLAATLIPPMLNLVMPFALYIGATQTLNGMNSDSELAVIEAAGGSRSIQTKPIIVLAIIMSLVALALSHFVEPFAYRHKRDIIARAGADLVRFAVQSGTFQEIESNLFVQIADQLPSGDFSGIFIADSRKPDTDLVYYAKHGAIHQNGDAEVLVLADGEVQRKNTQTGDLSVISFESYVLDFNQFGPTSGEVNYSPKERSSAYLLFGPRSDDFFVLNEPKDVRAEINRRFAEWLYSLVFGTIAIYFAVGARSNRQERLWSVTAGVAVALVVRGAGFFLVNVSGINPLYGFLNFAIPIGSILVFSTLILMNKSLRFSQTWVDGAGAIAAAATRRWTNFRFGGSAVPSPGAGDRP
jgi:lipopolysaccharide export system permease protein